MVESSGGSLSWKFRKRVWNMLLTLKFKGNKPVTFQPPVDHKRMIKSVPLGEYYSDIPIRNIRVADHIPADEASRLKRLFVTFQAKLSSSYPPMQSGLPPIDANPEAALAEAYTEAHRKLFPAPELPAEMATHDASELLGALAVKGPFAGYLTKVGDTLQWDLKLLDAYEHHPGLRKLGVRVEFDVDATSKSLRASRIESALGTTTPNDAAWPDAARLALCAASNHTSLVRHFNWVHLASGGPFAVATRNNLPSRHPLRRLLWPHMYGTQYSNDVVTEVQIGADGDFPNTFSFTFAGLCRLFSDTFCAYRITELDPKKDAAVRGIRDGGFETPTQDNLEELFAVIRAHTDRYVDAYYENDDALRDDKDVHFWPEELEYLIPNGIGDVTPQPATRAGVANLAACLIYLGCVQHEAMGTHLWNYQMWTNKIPVRVYENGQREPLDVYQRLVNANFNLNVRRAQLMQDFSGLAADERGKPLFKQFLSELTALDEEMKNRDSALWRIYPHVLEANINA